MHLDTYFIVGHLWTTLSAQITLALLNVKSAFMSSKSWSIVAKGPCHDSAKKLVLKQALKLDLTPFFNACQLARFHKSDLGLISWQLKRVTVTVPV